MTNFWAALTEANEADNDGSVTFWVLLRAFGADAIEAAQSFDHAATSDDVILARDAMAFVVDAIDAEMARCGIQPDDGQFEDPIRR